METRHKVELGIAILVLVGFVVLLALFMRDDAAPDVVTPDSGALEDTGERVPHPDGVDPADIPPPGVVSAMTIGRTFVERFGSYSSESDFANVDDILSLATGGFRVELEDIVANARKNDDAAYYGISTIVLSTTTVTEADVAVTLRMLTQREEAIDDPANATVRYQDILVDLVKIGDNWLVDGFTWQES